ncbi:T6SS immunity protein Tli3 family protein [Klebsiella michiganensis]|uniref:T6SS immunity protein Tli3 family protein n=1 Tax=Klebsiella michiganensis TaxID=1134687 RepID=UPI0034D1E555
MKIKGAIPLPAAHFTVLAFSTVLLTACHAGNRQSHKPPTQVVYRFDDHRYLELVGFNCEGALWYNDTQRQIRAEVVARDTPVFRISFFKYVHPSEKYIAVPWDDLSGFLISRDYGQTWGQARFSPVGGAKRYGNWRPDKDDVESFTVVNDQSFLLTRQGDLYISSKPFDDPRLQPGGEGILYSWRNSRGELEHDRLMPGSSGMDWGWEYTSWNAVAGPDHWSIFAHKPNWQGIPNKVPEVKNYTGWDHMRCDPDLGLTASEQGK